MAEDSGANLTAARLGPSAESHAIESHVVAPMNEGGDGDSSAAQHSGAYAESYLPSRFSQGRPMPSQASVPPR